MTLRLVLNVWRVTFVEWGRGCPVSGYLMCCSLNATLCKRYGVYFGS